MVDVIFNYDLLLSKIDEKYDGSTLGIKINKFCKDVKMKIYRFRKITEGSRYYFQADEIFRMKEVLNIKDTDLYFLNRKI